MQAAMAMEMSAMRAPRYCALPWAPASGLYWAKIRTASVYSACRHQEGESGLYWATMRMHRCNSACRHHEIHQPRLSPGQGQDGIGVQRLQGPRRGVGMVAWPTKHRFARCAQDSIGVQHLQRRPQAGNARAQHREKNMQGEGCTAATHQECCILPLGVVQEPAQAGKHEEHDGQDVGVGCRGGVEHGQEPHCSSNDRSQKPEDTLTDGDIDLQKTCETT